MRGKGTGTGMRQRPGVSRQVPEDQAPSCRGHRGRDAQEEGGFSVWGGGGDLSGFEAGCRPREPTRKSLQQPKAGAGWRRGWGDSVRPQFLAQVTRLLIEPGQLMRELRGSALEGGCWGADGGVGGGG